MIVLKENDHPVEGPLPSHVSQPPPTFDVATGACLHACKQVLLPFVSRIEMKPGCLIVIDGSKPVTLCRQQIAAVGSDTATQIAGIGQLFPFLIPGVLVLGIYPACGKEAFGNGRTAFLSRSRVSIAFATGSAIEETVSM